MKKIIWAIIIIAIITGVVFLFGKGGKDVYKNETIKIGAILPLTGDLAFLGEEIKKGIDIAVLEYKDKGVDINVIYEDDQSLSPIVAVNAANKLLNIDKINAGLTLLVEESRPIAPIFNKKKFHCWFFGIVIILFKNRAIMFSAMAFPPNLRENQWLILLIIS